MNPLKAQSTTQLLNLIHRATAQRKAQDNPELARLTDTAVSIMALHIRTPSAFVTEEQYGAITRLREILEGTNIHT